MCGEILTDLGTLVYINQIAFNEVGCSKSGAIEVLVIFTVNV
jgi:hypothetical protein